MPDLGHDVKEFQVFHWKPGSWKKLEKKMHSPEFECGGHKWCARWIIRCLPISYWNILKAHPAVPIRELKCTSE